MVEGDSEAYALPALLNKVGLDTKEKNIAILSTNGADSMDRYYRIFNEFQIPTYLLIN